MAPTTSHSTLPSTLLAHARSSPSRTFIECWSAADGVLLRCSYAQLADCMLAAAIWLRDGPAHVQSADHVAFLAHNSISYLSISLGAMTLGACSINLNWRNPADVTHRLLDDLKPKLLVASASFRALASAAHTALSVRIAMIEAICNMDASELPFAPLAEADAAALREQIATVSPSSPAAVFFTGGTTGTPKAVPHTHAGLLWFAECARATWPAPYEKPTAGTVCFTPFFHVMGFVANLAFNLHVGCRVALLGSADDKLSPSLVLAACNELRPTVLNTVPWIVEGLVEMLRQGEPADAASVLSAIDLVTYGGAALAPHCPAVLRAHGVTVACTYGQTELAGPVMMGKPNGDPNALRPIDGVGAREALQKRLHSDHCPHRRLRWVGVLTRRRVRLPSTQVTLSSPTTTTGPTRASSCSYAASQRPRATYRSLPRRAPTAASPAARHAPPPRTSSPTIASARYASTARSGCSTCAAPTTCSYTHRAK